jgi:CDP-paratose 2-epimerase
MMKNILVTGGSGFAGSHIAIRLKLQFPSAKVVALDNLKRRGSELALPRLRAAGVEFAHADIRCPEDLVSFKECDLLVECAAEPSALAGLDGNPQYVISTNLTGTVNCLELSRRTGAKLVFLSTSRVYPVESINALDFSETESRFELTDNQRLRGSSPRGIAENFPLEGPRTLYGSTKLASELFIQEYAESFGLEAVINRCGVLTGPWQMGKIDQGVVVLWIARHFFKGQLGYIGFGGTGKQVRDLLHIEDLCDLLSLQLENFEVVKGRTFNVGGGRSVSVSLRELTELCQRATKNTIPVKQVSEDRPGDVRVYLTDTTLIEKTLDWRPQRSSEQIVDDVCRWLSENRAALEPVLG